MGLNDISLPKWPQMLVSGKAVTVEQAKEIIFRTDCFLTDINEHSGGNNKEFNKWYRDASGISEILSLDWDKRRGIQEDLGYLGVESASNDWASCCFVFGPHGWCHPDGTIMYYDNIGKWPTVPGVLEDWKKVAEAFPFLDLHITLMSGEGSDDDTIPLVNLRVVGGTVSLCPPDITVHEGKILQRDSDKVFELRFVLGANYELGLPYDWYMYYANRVRSTLVKTGYI